MRNTVLCLTVLLAAVASAQWLETTIQLPDSSWPNGLFYVPAVNKVYSADWSANRVSAIDGATNTITATIPTAAIRLDSAQERTKVMPPPLESPFA